MKRDIKQVWHLNHPAELVWEYLTDPELLAQWLMENNIKPIVGHKFQFKTRAMPGFDGNVFCEVLEAIPQKRFSYSWKGGPMPGKITLDSVVIWTLKPIQNGTELTLEHNGFEGLKNLMAYMGMNMGWKKKIKTRLEELLKNHGNATV